MRDICYILGAGLFGYGLWLCFPPLLYVYAGCMLMGTMVVTSRGRKG